MAMTPLSNTKTETAADDNSAVIPKRRTLSWKNIFNFKFMTHDRWANVLFLHWKIPSHMEKVLQDNTSPFLLDRYPNNDEDGSVYVGLILLTEQNVGPSIGRSQWTTVTHHGVNVRTYVKACEKNNPPGIHFSSLECDDELTSLGANRFGMPYRVAQIQRFFVMRETFDGLAVTTDTTNTTTDIDQITCSDKNINQIQRFGLRSERLASERPSLWRIFTTMIGSIFRKATPKHTSERKLSIESPVTTNHTSTFTVDCSWSMCKDSTGPTLSKKMSPQQQHDETSFAQWAVERYHVYTQKYGFRWSGRVEHEPWPLQQVALEGLAISGVDSYEPSQMRPILEHMANHRPDSVLFSPGVGPVQFNMLRPL
ncbi:COG2071 domain containing protein [Nitzschia inconspicua]|uniref:COG2071 domain containing protein n=1 Tax=Nitzschia inconspicua TaxID=303405 RepID=A0A9K3KZI3_9STRA|nr:COG2071 domain containing protein [Nitzschia inconspicua]